VKRPDHPKLIGVPVTAPELERESPVGRLPLVIDHVYGVVPPAASKENEYAVLWVAFVISALMIFSGPAPPTAAMEIMIPPQSEDAAAVMVIECDPADNVALESKIPSPFALVTRCVEPAPAPGAPVLFFPNSIAQVLVPIVVSEHTSEVDAVF
jgi:hypothetical protein